MNGNGKCDCENCAECAECSRYHIGDVVELSPLGVIALGGRMLNRGTVTGYSRDRSKQIVLVIRWHNMALIMEGKVKPIWIQKPFTAERPFI